MTVGSNDLMQDVLGTLGSDKRLWILVVVEDVFIDDGYQFRAADGKTDTNRKPYELNTAILNNSMNSTERPLSANTLLAIVTSTDLISVRVTSLPQRWPARRADMRGLGLRPDVV